MALAGLMVALTSLIIVYIKDFKADTQKNMEILRTDTQKSIEALRADTQKSFEILRTDTQRSIEVLQADVREIRTLNHHSHSGIIIINPYLLRLKQNQGLRKSPVGCLPFQHLKIHL